MKKYPKDVILPVLAISAITIGLLPVFVYTDAKQSEYDIPTWVKGIAGFWVEDKISDKDFGDGLSFLINEGIITVPSIESLQSEVSELEEQITLLESQVDLLEDKNKELEEENTSLKIERIRTPPIHGDPPRDPPQ